MTDLALRSLLGLASTLLAYVLALALHRRLRFLHPLLVTC